MTIRDYLTLHLDTNQSKGTELSVAVLHKHQRIPKGVIQMDNPEKPATHDTQDEVKQNKNTMQ